MYDVKLPIIDWFLAGNDYSGSFRPDISKGCLSQTTFNYQVKPYNDKNKTYLMALCFYQLPWNATTNIDEAYIGRFEASAFGLDVCSSWIRSKFVLENVLHD